MISPTTCRSIVRAALVAVIAVLVAACVDPLARTQEQALRERLLATHRAYTQSVADAPLIHVTREPGDVQQKLEESGRVGQLDAMSGPSAYDHAAIALGADLAGQTEATLVTITLQRAIELAVANNLDLQLARLVPAARQAELTRAEAAFDATLFTNLDYSAVDDPDTSTATFGDRATQTTNLLTGIRKPLTTGGEMRAQTELAVNKNIFGAAITDTNPLYEANVLVGLSQPLLRGFGTDVNRAQIELLESDLRSDIADLSSRLMQLALDTEAGYWRLVEARQRLLIQQRLLQRTIEDRDRLEQRKAFDVSPVRITEANSFVELRRADVIRARNDVRLASDRLKALVNSPDLPVSGEALLAPMEMPADIPIDYSLLDAVTTALRHRPEIEQALLTIEDAAIRQRVADNLRLPMLDLDAAMRFHGWDGDDAGGAYDNLTEADYIDYLISAQLEIPIGNRAAEAMYQQRKIERLGAVIAYQRAAQSVVLEVKEALRNLLTSYELIGATRAARRAAADNLRAIEEQEKAGVALTPEFLLDLKLQTQQRLADAEVQEIQALAQYNVAVATLYRTMGTLLQRNRIAFVYEVQN